MALSMAPRSSQPTTLYGLEPVDASKHQTQAPNSKFNKISATGSCRSTIENPFTTSFSLQGRAKAPSQLHIHSSLPKTTDDNSPPPSPSPSDRFYKHGGGNLEIPFARLESRPPKVKVDLATIKVTPEKTKITTGTDGPTPTKSKLPKPISPESKKYGEILKKGRVVEAVACPAGRCSSGDSWIDGIESVLNAVRATSRYWSQVTEECQHKDFYHEVVEHVCVNLKNEPEIVWQAYLDKCHTKISTSFINDGSLHWAKPSYERNSLPEQLAIHDVCKNFIPDATLGFPISSLCNIKDWPKDVRNLYNKAPWHDPFMGKHKFCFPFFNFEYKNGWTSILRSKNQVHRAMTANLNLLEGLLGAKQCSKVAVFGACNQGAEIWLIYVMKLVIDKSGATRYESRNIAHGDFRSLGKVENLYRTIATICHWSQDYLKPLIRTALHEYIYQSSKIDLKSKVPRTAPDNQFAHPAAVNYLSLDHNLSPPQDTEVSGCISSMRAGLCDHPDHLQVLIDFGVQALRNAVQGQARLILSSDEEEEEDEEEDEEDEEKEEEEEEEEEEKHMRAGTPIELCYDVPSDENLETVIKPEEQAGSIQRETSTTQPTISNEDSSSIPPHPAVPTNFNRINPMVETIAQMATFPSDIGLEMAKNSVLQNAVVTHQIWIYGCQLQLQSLVGFALGFLLLVFQCLLPFLNKLEYLLLLYNPFVQEIDSGLLLASISLSWVDIIPELEKSTRPFYGFQPTNVAV